MKFYFAQRFAQQQNNARQPLLLGTFLATYLATALLFLLLSLLLLLSIPVAGKYIYIEASHPRRKGDKAKIAKMLSFTGLTCVDFYYHMYGSTMGTLNVYVGKRRVFRLSGNQGIGWKKARSMVYMTKVLPVRV